MHKSPKNFVLASAAMALALAPAMAGAQDQTMPGNAPQNAPSSMPQTGPVTTQPTAPTPPPSSGPDTGSPTEDMDTQSTDTTTSDTSTTDTTGTDTAGTPQPAGTRSRMIARADQQAAIQSWPAETQTYYKSLTTERQNMFWALTDSDKVRLSKMPEAQRDAAWTQIEAQLAPTKG